MREISYKDFIALKKNTRVIIFAYNECGCPVTSYATKTSKREVQLDKPYDRSNTAEIERDGRNCWPRCFDMTGETDESILLKVELEEAQHDLLDCQNHITSLTKALENLKVKGE